MRYQSEWRGQGTKGKRNARCEVIGKRAEKKRKEKKRKEKRKRIELSGRLQEILSEVLIMIEMVELVVMWSRL